MTILSKTAGAVSLVSCLHDIHKTAMIGANNGYAKASGDAMVSNSVGNQKINHLSYKDAQRKNWIAKKDFMVGTREIYGRVKGYIKGALSASVRYIPNFILSAIAICCKGNTPEGKRVGNIAALGLGIVEGIDFIRNSTNIGQRTDYLK